MCGESITTIHGDQTFTVDEVKCFRRFIFRETTMDEIILQHGRDADTCTSSSEEHETVFMGFKS